MSQENVEIVRESVARFARGDIDGLADLYAADAVTFAPEGWPEGGRFDGRDAVKRQFARLQRSSTVTRSVCARWYGMGADVLPFG